MSIPSRICAVGYDSWYVKLYRELCQLLGSPLKFKLDWLASEKKLVIHTDRVDDTVLAEVAAIAATLVPAKVDIDQYNHHIEISWRDINKYAECVTVSDMLAVNPDYKNDLTSDGAWVYPLTNQQDFSDGTKWWRGDKNIKRAILSTNAIKMAHIFYNSGLLHLEVDAPYCTHIDTTFCSRILLTAKCNLPSLIDGNYGFYDFRGQEFIAEFPNMTRALHMFFNSENLTRALIKMPKLSTADALLYNSKLDRESVVYILGNIPAHASGTHKLTIGIHIDHQNDDEVLAAIANAEAKGWTLTVQWNPGGPVYTTPTT